MLLARINLYAQGFRSHSVSSAIEGISGGWGSPAEAPSKPEMVTAL